MVSRYRPFVNEKGCRTSFFVFFGQDKNLRFFCFFNFKAPPIYHIDLFQFPAINAKAFPMDFAYDFLLICLWHFNYLAQKKPARGLSSPTMGQSNFFLMHSSFFKSIIRPQNYR
jgi:hypothetical protein